MPLWSNLFSPQRWNKSPSITYHTDRNQRAHSDTSWPHFFSSTFFALSTSVCWFPNLLLGTWLKSKPGLCMQRERGDKENMHHPRWAGGKFTKQGRLHMRLVLGAGRPVDLFICHQNHRSLCRHLNRVQTPTQSRWSQPEIIVLRLHPWGGSWEQKTQVECTFQGQRSG